MLAAGFAPDILVSDVAMPGMDGVSLLREIRRRLPSLPAVLVSGYSEHLMEREALDAFLAAPHAAGHL